MADNRRRNTLVAIAILIIIAILLLLISCPGKKTPAAPPPATTSSGAQPAPVGGAAPVPAGTGPQERLTGATITAPEKTPAGSTFSLTWTGPDNPGDYISIVPRPSPNNTAGNYKETKTGTTLDLTAPITPGPYELRYVTGQSHAILGRAWIEVTATTAAIESPAEVPLGAPFTLTWTGPNNKGDYITIVEKSAADGVYSSYAETEKGSSLTLTAPTTTGDHELRYITGQDKKVLARRAIKVLAPTISLTAPDTAVAGSTIDVTWTGPNNAGDYITIVPKETPDGQYANYTDTAKGSPLRLLTPIMSGPAELRYMTSQNQRVLGRRAITITAAPVSLSAAPEAAPSTEVSITWTGPNNPGDYITIVVKATPDGQYAAYTLTGKGSPLTVTTPKSETATDAEVRYMTGQGNKVLARIPLRIVP